MPAKSTRGNVFVYEDPCIGMIIEAVGELNAMFHPTTYPKLKQTAPPQSVADVIMASPVKILFVEFKAPLNTVASAKRWEYDLSRLNQAFTKYRGTFDFLLRRNILYLGAIHAWADPRKAATLQNREEQLATFIHAPFSTLFIPLNARTINSSKLVIHGIRPPYRMLKPQDLTRPLKALSLTMSLIRAYDASGTFLCAGEFTVSANTGPLTAYRLPTLVKCMARCRLGLDIASVKRSDLGKIIDLVNAVREVLERPYAVISTRYLTTLLDVASLIDLLTERPEIM